MSNCGCCLTYGSQVLVGGANIGPYTISVSVDTTRDVIWETGSDEECAPLTDKRIYMYGPGKSTMQLTAYPFSNEDDEYTLGFTCPTEVNVQFGYKWVFDCRQCVDCIDIETGQVSGKVRGRWIPIPLKKRQVIVTGDIENSLFTFKGCASPAAKFNIQAGPQSVIIPQITRQFSGMEYHGLPLSFDTDDMGSARYNLTVTTNANCSYAMGFSNIDAWMTGFSFSFNPPAPPTCTYSFDVPLSYCPEC